jgi:long-subunit fatty acid transport protein
MKSSITYNDGATENYSAYPDKKGVYDYEIETPMRYIFSGAYVIGKSGLISVDYEIVDYSTSKLKNGSDGYNYIDENIAITKAYKTTGNLHIGGEYRVNKSFSLRAGYENFPSVYQASYLNSENLNSDSSYSTIAGGFGFRQGSFFFDATYKQVMNNEYLKLYPGATNMAKYATTQNNVIFTLGYKF